jgi:hypothetical protein
MVWKPREWKRAAEQLQSRCWLFVGKLSSVVANEEARIARMELGGRLKSSPSMNSRKDHD